MQLKSLNRYIVYSKREKSGHSKLWLLLAASIGKILYLFKEIVTNIIIWFSTIADPDDLLPGVQFNDLTPYGIYEKLQTKLIFDYFFVIPISEMWGKNVHSFYLRPKG